MAFIPTFGSYIINKYIIIFKTILIQYSNKYGFYFFCRAGMTNDYYYQRTFNYEEIIHRKEVGCFDVPMVHSAVLISLRYKNSNLLTYDPEKVKNYDGPVDDIIAFAVSAKKLGNILFYV